MINEPFALDKGIPLFALKFLKKYRFKKRLLVCLNNHQFPVYIISNLCPNSKVQTHAENSKKPNNNNNIFCSNSYCQNPKQLNKNQNIKPAFCHVIGITLMTECGTF